MQTHFDCLWAEDVPEPIRVGEQVFIPLSSGPTARDWNVTFPRFSGFTHEVNE